MSHISLIARAQKAVASHNYSEAIEIFTKVLDANLVSNKALPLLSRSTCFMELEKYDEAISDALGVLELDDSHSSIEFLPNCFSTFAAAYTRLAHAYEALGNKDEQAKYQKLFTEYNKTMAGRMGEADELREQGNALYKAGNLEAALDKYTQAKERDPSRPEVFGNLALVLSKLGRLAEALKSINEALAINPSWEKAWYRKGSILLQQKRYSEAALVFQQGLGYAPEDSDMKQGFVRASKASETAKDSSGFNTKFMGMMAELRHSSFDVNSWFRKGGATRAHICTCKGEKNLSAGIDWNKDIVHVLSNTELHKKLTALIKPVWPMFDASKAVPATLVHAEITDKTSPLSYFLPDYPLLTLLIFHAIFSFAQPQQVDDWAMVFTLTLPQSQKESLTKNGVTSPSFPYIVDQQIVMLLLGDTDGGKDPGYALDLWSWYDSLVLNKQLSAKSFSPAFLALKNNLAELKATDGVAVAPFVQKFTNKELEIDEYGLNKQTDLASTSFYTCDNPSRMREFVEDYYKNRDMSSSDSLTSSRDKLSEYQESHARQQEAAKTAAELVPVSEKLGAADNLNVRVARKPVGAILETGQIVLALGMGILSVLVFLYFGLGS